MKTLTRSALIARPPEQVFALVNDVASYPQFVPGCSSAKVLLQSETEIVARLKVHRGPLSTQLTTRNRPRPYSEIRLELVAGPLRALDGLWTFTPVATNGCRIELQLQFEFSNSLKAALLDPLIEGVATSMVQAFVGRAQRSLA
jgi:ribosome-associated toxin RatA of RatAB toxin-antitoxin module